MGYIDKITATVSCTKCSALETQRVLQYGSSKGASWGDFKPFAKFEAKFDTKDNEPEVASATCKACGAVAEISHRSST